MNTAYNITLLVHSWNRWLILIAGLVTIASAIRALSSKSDYSSRQKKWYLIYMGSLHLQLLVGLVLYFVLSPVTTQALNNFGLAMKDPVMRFFAVEHAFINILAIAIAQIGSILIKRRSDATGKHKTALMWAGISFLLILSMIPMGMMGVARPLFRF